MSDTFESMSTTFMAWPDAPYPWRTGQAECHVYDDDGLIVAICVSPMIAESIVKAVNATAPPEIAASLCGN